MRDLVFLAVIVGFFALAALVVAGVRSHRRS